MRVRFGPSTDTGTPEDPRRSFTMFIDDEPAAMVTVCRLPEGCITPEPDRLTLIVRCDYDMPPETPTPTRKKREPKGPTP